MVLVLRKPAMGPRTDKKADLQRLIEDYNIIFKGPVPPQDWPGHLKFQHPRDGTYNHRFSVFRKIWSNRYDRLKSKGDLNNKNRGDHEEFVNSLRDTARSLRKDININESTWRHHLEGPVFRKFRENVIWLVLQNIILTLRSHADTVRDVVGRKNISQSTKRNRFRNMIRTYSV